VYGGSRAGALVCGPGPGKARFETVCIGAEISVVGDLDSGSVTGPFAYTPGDTVLGMPVEYLSVDQEARHRRLARQHALERTQEGAGWCPRGSQHSFVP